MSSERYLIAFLYGCIHSFLVAMRAVKDIFTRQTPHVHMVYVRVPPIALDAWSMALVLWQPPEYYYY